MIVLKTLSKKQTVENVFCRICFNITYIYQALNVDDKWSSVVDINECFALQKNKNNIPTFGSIDRLFLILSRICAF